MSTIPKLKAAFASTILAVSTTSCELSSRTANMGDNAEMACINADGRKSAGQTNHNGVTRMGLYDTDLPGENKNVLYLEARGASTNAIVTNYCNNGSINNIENAISGADIIEFRHVDMESMREIVISKYEPDQYLHKFEQLHEDGPAFTIYKYAQNEADTKATDKFLKTGIINLGY